ncbi:uncharacterized protein LOC121371237 isoform X2 [Gigantopelta aegis]|uniref:uncharacterized protein LOC121371237 isoform X2 n=1 Tax=Gigantopelta aegis TaxID=1735272 RepID=UPI001B888A6D|nr:uncharacterized protein LOC121371237 isoform X2 [Gigantopelta aegis]
MADPLSPKSPRKGKHVNIRIQFLDDTVHAFPIPVKAVGETLWACVCQHLQLLEADYFDLQYYSEHKLQSWLDRDKPILKQLPSPDTPLKFCVKFYTPDPGLLEDELTRYFFALQIKQDLLLGVMPCSENTAALLASYIAQAEIGDCLDEYQDHTYLSSIKFVPHQTPDLEQKIMEYHKQHIGESPSEADLNLLDTARKMELYGIRMNQAKDHEGVPLNLAVAHMGVLVFQNSTKINTFSWAKIRKLSFKRKKFLIKLHPESYGYYKDTVEFFFDSRNECKSFWKKCIEHHAFFRCQVVKKLPRKKARVVSRGSSFRYSGRTQKELMEYVRGNIDTLKKLQFERSASGRISSRSTSVTPKIAMKSTSIHNSSDLHNSTASSGSHILDTPHDNHISPTRVETAEIHSDSSMSGSRSLGSPRMEHSHSLEGTPALERALRKTDSVDSSKTEALEQRGADYNCDDVKLKQNLFSNSIDMQTSANQNANDNDDGIDSASPVGEVMKGGRGGESVDGSSTAGGRERDGKSVTFSKVDEGKVVGATKVDGTVVNGLVSDKDVVSTSLPHGDATGRSNAVLTKQGSSFDSIGINGEVPPSACITAKVFVKDKKQEHMQSLNKTETTFGKEVVTDFKASSTCVTVADVNPVARVSNVEEQTSVSEVKVAHTDVPPLVEKVKKTEAADTVKDVVAVGHSVSKVKSLDLNIPEKRKFSADTDLISDIPYTLHRRVHTNSESTEETAFYTAADVCTGPKVKPRDRSKSPGRSTKKAEGSHSRNSSCERSPSTLRRFELVCCHNLPSKTSFSSKDDTTSPSFEKEILSRIKASKDAPLSNGSAVIVKEEVESSEPKGLESNSSTESKEKAHDSSDQDQTEKKQNEDDASVSTIGSKPNQPMSTCSTHKASSGSVPSTAPISHKPNIVSVIQPVPVSGMPPSFKQSAPISDRISSSSESSDMAASKETVIEKGSISSESRSSISSVDHNKIASPSTSGESDSINTFGMLTKSKGLLVSDSGCYEQLDGEKDPWFAVKPNTKGSHMVQTNESVHSPGKQSSLIFDLPSPAAAFLYNGEDSPTSKNSTPPASLTFSTFRPDPLAPEQPEQPKKEAAIETLKRWSLQKVEEEEELQASSSETKTEKRVSFHEDIDIQQQSFHSDVSMLVMRSPIEEPDDSSFYDSQHEGDIDSGDILETLENLRRHSSESDLTYSGSESSENESDTEGEMDHNAAKEIYAQYAATKCLEDYGEKDMIRDMTIDSGMGMSEGTSHTREVSPLESLERLEAGEFSEKDDHEGHEDDDDDDDDDFPPPPPALEFPSDNSSSSLDTESQPHVHGKRLSMDPLASLERSDIVDVTYTTSESESDFEDSGKKGDTFIKPPPQVTITPCSSSDGKSADDLVSTASSDH